MDEPLMDVRPRIGRKLALWLGGAALVVALGWGAAQLLAWWENREREHAQAAAQPYEDEARALEERIRARLADVVAIVSNDRTAGPPHSNDPTSGTARPVDAPATCPETVTGVVPLVQRPWLSWLASGEGYDAQPHQVPWRLNSDAFMYLGRVVTPSWGRLEQLEERNQRYRELRDARYLAIHTPRIAEDVKLDRHTFEGGRVEGRLTIVDTQARQVLCEAPIASQPMFVVSLEQDTEAASRQMQDRAAGEAMVRSFWKAAREAVARVAPSATLAAPDPR